MYHKYELPDTRDSDIGTYIQQIVMECRPIFGKECDKVKFLAKVQSLSGYIITFRTR